MKMMESQNDKIESLFELRDQLINDGHYACDDVKKRLDQALRMRDDLENDAKKREKFLKDALAFKSFRIDIDEVVT